MAKLLNAPFIMALITVISWLATVAGIIPAPLSEAFIGEIVSTILTLATAKAGTDSSVNSVDGSGAVR